MSADDVAKPSRRVSVSRVCLVLVFVLGLRLVSAMSPLGDPKQGAERVFYGGNRYDTFTVNLRADKLELLFADDQGRRIGSLGAARDFLASKKRKVVFATNGGMFNPEWQPNGLFVEEGLTVYPMDLSNREGNFYLKPNGVFYLSESGAGIVPSEEFSEISEYVRYATQSGPMLVHAGKIHKAFRSGSGSKHIRSGVGILDDNRVVFAISKEPVNFYEFAKLFKARFGCVDALYLDGTISKMYLPALNRHELDGDFGVMIAVSR